MSRSRSSLKKALRMVVGFHSCQEAVKAHPDKIRDIYFQDINEAKKPYWESLLSGIRARPQVRGAAFFKDLSEFGHQGIAVATEHWPEWDGEAEVDSSLLLFLDGLEDPHNLGAIIRTSWLMKVDCIGVTEKNSVKMTPTVCKIASGGAEHVPVQEFNFVSDLKDLKDQGYWIYGFSDKGAHSLYKSKFPSKTVLVFGSEEKGVRSSVLNMCDEVLSIPQQAVGASYNVSVSVGIGLSEFCRQTRLG